MTTDMGASGVRGLLIYCSDYQCSHRIAISADPWPDDARLSGPCAAFRLLDLQQARCRCPDFDCEQEARQAMTRASATGGGHDEMPRLR